MTTEATSQQPTDIRLSTDTTPFAVTHPLFSELRAKSLELGMTLDQIDAQIELLNQSPLAVALLHTYEERTRGKRRDPVKTGSGLAITQHA
ncbi:MAG: hypothetical protein ACOY3Z_07555 [Thermodesulfobacteriota bacterium]